MDRTFWTTCCLSLPSPVSQMLQHSGGSPAERCHCSAEQVQSEHLSAIWLLDFSIWLCLSAWVLLIAVIVPSVQKCSFIRISEDDPVSGSTEREFHLPDRHCCILCGRGRGRLRRSAWSAGRCRPSCSSSQSARSNHTSAQEQRIREFLPLRND